MQKQEKQFQVIGKATPRIDAVEQVTGEASYLQDLFRFNMLYGAVVRSPIPHGRILNIDISRAKRVHGIEVVLTGEDFPSAIFGYHIDMANKLPLVKKKVRYIGDEIVAIAARSEEAAQEACSLIKIDFEPLPAIFDLGTAVGPDAPLIHEDRPGNISGEVHKAFGDVELGFSQSDYIFEETYRTTGVSHCCMETRGAFAEFDARGQLTLWSTTQFPHILRDVLARTLNLPVGKIRVRKAHIGGGFGSRQSMDAVDPIAAFLAMRSKKPVRLVKTRSEEFLSDRIRYPMIMTLKTGVNKRGELLARQIEILTDGGAYNDQGLYVTTSAGSKITGLYRVPNIKFDGKVIFTNKVWGGAFRGYGNPQVTFAIESQMDQIAEKLGMDPLELRLLNANEQGEVTVAGSKLISCGFKECLEKSTAVAGWKKKRKNRKNNKDPKVRGIGMGSLFHTGGGSIGAHGSSFSAAFIKVESDGSVDLLTGVPDVGQGSDTVLAMIAAEELGLKVEDIRVHAGDTYITPYTLGVRGSRETFMAGNAVKLAARKAKDELFKRATSYLDVKEELLKAAHGKIFHRSKPDLSVTVAELAAKPMFDRYGAFPVGVPIVASACYQDTVSEFSDEETGYGNICPCWVYGSQVAEVEVDTETGQVKVLHVVAAHDVGRAINPLAIEGQFEGAILQGIGFALTEQIIWDQGKVMSEEFADYKLPTFMEIPKITTILVETDDPFGPFGAKGVGEAAIVPTAAAIANAVYDAVGVRINELPITQEKLLAAIRSMKG